MIGFLQAACTSRATPAQAPVDAPDLVLRGARFDRLVEGRVVAAGSARELSYWRAGGRFAASGLQLSLHPGPGTAALERFGRVDLETPSVTGDVGERTAHAAEGVQARAASGQTAFAQVVELDGPASEVRAPAGLDFSGEGQRLHATSGRAPLDGSRVDLVAVRGRLDGPAGKGAR